MIQKLILPLLLLFLVPPAHSEGKLESVSLEGGPIWTKHFQAGDEDYRSHHGLGVLKVHTEGYGNWGLYVLAPNSVDRTSIGAGYVTDPYAIPLGPVDLELSGALGLVTGYQDYPVPLLAAEARLVLYKKNNWDAGIATAAIPYYSDDRRSENKEFGVVITSPFLSVRHKF